MGITREDVLRMQTEHGWTYEDVICELEISTYLTREEAIRWYSEVVERQE